MNSNDDDLPPEIDFARSRPNEYATKQIVIPTFLHGAPPDPKSLWWILGAFDTHGTLCFSARLIAGPGTVPHIATYAAALCNSYPHIVVTTGEPDHETVYEISHGQILINRLGEFR